ncbi:hypothetical protein [Cytobacillus pseudoceanisediminis]|uniref:hypothetical protein n=1 Tax=Cytobacillus pseudoceanisediminis TaxID=3051614 RepID=UPI003C2B2EB1
MNKFKEILETHSFFVLLGVGVTVFGTGWAASEYIRVNPLQTELADAEKLLSKYESTIQLASENDYASLVVYDNGAWLKTSDKISILGGQVEIEIRAIQSRSDVQYSVDAIGEKELQFIETTPSSRAVFMYDGDEYLINIIDYIDDIMRPEIKLSVSKVKE